MDLDHEYDIVGRYIPTFVQHLKDTGARLGLRVGSQVDEDQTSAGDAVEEVAEADALSGWTPAEHDAFFRALSVHSRWRPDLIAACIPTRTEWEVWMYLDALEEGTATLATHGEDVDMEDGFRDEHGDVDSMQVDGTSSDSRSHSGSDTEDLDLDLDLDLCQPALEVSQAWINVEERMASWVVHEEYLTSVEDVADHTEGMDDKPPERKRGRPRGGRARSLVRGQTVSNEGYDSPPHRSQSPTPASTSKRKHGALMGRLELPHLVVLDNILREDEEATKEKSKSRESSVAAVTPIEHGDAKVPRARGAEMSSSHRITAPQGTSNTPECSSNAVIDPVLLVISGGADPTGCQSGRVPSESTSTSCAPPHQGPSSLPNVPSQPTAGELSSQPGIGNATLTNPEPTANVESDLTLFSPRSRRRIQKRLYMRRKRASLREDGTASGGAVYTGTDRLKPGKKAKRSEMSLVSSPVPCSEATSDDEMKLPENVPKKNKPGLTLPYKLKAQFAELGIDAAYLRGQGMDLLNLSALGKLMGLYSSLEQSEEADGSAIAMAIDGQLIRHLQAAMVMFVTDITHRVIVWREREIRLKQRSRAWRHGDQITIGAVEHAVQAVGARYRSHGEYFKSLGAFHGLWSEPSSAYTSEEQPVEPSPHRDVYTPLIRPPSAWRIGPLGCLTRTYEREATRTRRGTSAEIPEDELMPDETDEEALEDELEDEDKVDVRDKALSGREEEGLWARLDKHV